MKTVDDHNGPQWLVVRYLAERPKASREPFFAGWHVVRVCSCHLGQAVSWRPYDSENDAERGREVILSVGRAA
jgi:hypothetical protein